MKLFHRFICIFFLIINLNANTLKCTIDNKEDSINIEFFNNSIKINNKYKAFFSGIYKGNKNHLQNTHMYENKGYKYYILNNGNGYYFIYIDSKYEGFQVGQCNYNKEY